jgi:two-component system nitrogen regulation response regulator GlnG
LVIDDDAVERKLLSVLLSKAGGYGVATAEDGASGLSAAERVSPDLVLLDLKLPDLSGMEVLKKLKSAHPPLPVLMLTGVTDVKKAVEAIQAGAYNYLTKPFENDHLLLTVRQALEKVDLMAEMAELRRSAGKSPALSRLLGSSKAMGEAVAQVRKVASSDLTVLIQGETGTGKELAARALHEESSRRERPFVAVDCGALTETLLESELFGHEKGAFTGADRRKEGQVSLAQGGTLFLDEVGNLPLGLQTKLLRVLQERQVRPVGAERSFPVDVRFVAATNEGLEGAAKAGKFRQDLFYRLAEFTLYLPPLRERKGDILVIAQRFLMEASVELKKAVGSVDEDAAKLLSSHPWPGNVRELRNVIRQAVLLTPDSVVHAAQVRELLGKGKGSLGNQGPVEVPVTPGMSLKEIAEEAVEHSEKQAIRNVLKATGGNKAKAAKVLKTDYKTLHVKIKKYKLQF